MIGKLNKGRSMSGLMQYLLAPIDQKGETRPRVKIVGGTFASRTSEGISREFGVLRGLRPRLQVAVVHESLRLPPEAEEPTDEQWLEIARYWTSKMGFQAWVAVAHGDRHMHIAASRIRVDGDVVPDKNDYSRSEQAIREIETIFRLEATKPSHLLDAGGRWEHEKAPTRQQLAVEQKTGQHGPGEIVAAVIDSVLSRDGEVTVSALITALEEAGIDVRPNIASTGKFSGLAYRVGDILVTSKAMGRRYTWANMERRGLKFRPEKDLPNLFAARERSLARETIPSDSPLADLPRTYRSRTTGDALDTANGWLAAEAVDRFLDAAAGRDFAVVVNQVDGTQVRVAPTLTMDTAALRKLLSDNAGELGLEPTDPSVVAIGGLNPAKISELDSKGYEPFAVVRSGHDYQACIRLTPPDAPKPSPETRLWAAKRIAHEVGGAVLSAIRLPSRPTPAGSRALGKHRTVLHRAARVVARMGRRLLRTLEAMLAERSAALAQRPETFTPDQSPASSSTSAVPYQGLPAVEQQAIEEKSREQIDPASDYGPEI